MRVLCLARSLMRLQSDVGSQMAKDYTEAGKSTSKTAPSNDKFVQAGIFSFLPCGLLKLLQCPDEFAPGLLQNE